MINFQFDDETAIVTGQPGASAQREPGVGCQRRPSGSGRRKRRGLAALAAELPAERVMVASPTYGSPRKSRSWCRTYAALRLRGDALQQMPAPASHTLPETWA